MTIPASSTATTARAPSTAGSFQDLPAGERGLLGGERPDLAEYLRAVIGSFWKRRRPEQRPEIAQHEERPCEVNEQPEPKRRRRPKSTLVANPRTRPQVAGRGGRGGVGEFCRNPRTPTSAPMCASQSRWTTPRRGSITSISVDPDSGVGPWAPPHRYNKLDQPTAPSTPLCASEATTAPIGFGDQIGVSVMGGGRR